MRYKEQRYYLCTLFILWISTFTCHSQGLLFYGNEKRINERTSYSVFGEGNRPTFANKFCITFDYSIKNPESSGYIFSLNDRESRTIYSFTYLYKETDYRLFSFNEEGKRTLCIFQLHKDSLTRPSFNIALSLDLDEDVAEISLGSERQVISHIGLQSKSFSPSIHFGIYDYMLDMASFAIRNLSVSDGKRSWNFTFNENSGKEVHDDQGKVTGQVKNPVWLINQSYYWKKLLTAHSNTPSGVNYDDKLQKFYLFNQDSLTVYDLVTHSLTTTPYANRLPVHLVLGMSFIDPDRSELYAYEVNNLPAGDITTAALNPVTREWRKIGRSSIDTQRHHHTGFFDRQTGTYTLFGGYGSRTYSNTFMVYDINRDRWDTLAVSGDRIAPRYFAGMAVTPDSKRMYLYGGMGNESGDQDVGRNYFYDLYRVDREQKKVKKLWQQKAPPVNRVVARSMILTPDETYLYLLGYPEYMPGSYLQLYRMTVADGSSVAMGDSIAMVSEEIATNANLFANTSRGEFYCTTQEFGKDGSVTTHIYSLAAPPVALEAMKYYENRAQSSPGWRWMVLAGVAAVLTFIYIQIRRRRKYACQQSIQEEITLQEVDNIPPTKPQDALPAGLWIDQPAEAFEAITNLPEIIPAQRNAVFLFGSFAVIDRNARDITYMFSPKLRIIFLYIFLHSLTKEGVLSSDMNELFWAEKADEKVKNLKGVTLNHLRKIIQDIDGLELTFQKGYFKLVVDDIFYCDYLVFNRLTQHHQQDLPTERYATELIEILSRGKFLSGMESELFDYFKQKTENFIHTLLPIRLSDMYRNRKYDTVVRLCHILFATDALSEQALFYYICSYQKMGMPDKAIKRYHLFAKEYKREMNEDYKVPYESIVLPLDE